MKKLKELTTKEMNQVKGGTIMGSGTDGGGYYIVVDTGSSCEKIYVERPDEFPHVH
jgi:bacteriocin-like protein